ncbi:MAG: fumarylacetoacetate hydrolase family protein [Dehalococcoidia bacterium]
MGLDHHHLHEFAHDLMHARESLTPIPPLTQTAPEITADDAYHIAADIIGHLVEDGRRVIGKKVGLTSKPMQEALGIDTPDFGVLLDDMTVRDGGRVRRNTLIQPRVEPEIAFRLKSPLRGPGITAEQVLEATEYVLPVLEIVDSRIEGWRIKEADTIADNGSSALVVLGSMRAPVNALDLKKEAVVLSHNGVEMYRGAGAAVLGNPAEAVAWCANKLAEFGAGIGAGEIVLPGSLTGAVEVQAGDTVSAEFASLGVVSVRFT